jgi:hypothetical protein
MYHSWFYGRLLSKAYNAYTDFDKIIALFELRKWKAIVQGV